MDQNFSAVCFIEFMAEKWGTKYFENVQAESDNQNFVHQVNEEPIQTNTDLCVIGFFSSMVVHHNYCGTCEENLDKKTRRSLPIV